MSALLTPFTATVPTSAADIILGLLEGDPRPPIPDTWKALIEEVSAWGVIDVRSDGYLLGREWIGRVRDGRSLEPIQAALTAAGRHHDWIAALEFASALAEATLAHLNKEAASRH